MGNSPSTTCPVNQNSCIDEGEVVPQNNYCYATTGFNNPDIDKFVKQWCLANGGLNQQGDGTYQYPEWNGSIGDNNCLGDSEDSPCSMSGTGCRGGHCAFVGYKALCTKTQNFGDPLQCCLRDYQCNDGTNVFGKTCFSNDTKNATCAPEFRATDTQQCKYVTMQYCLGNYSTSNPNTSSTFLKPGQDFTALWVNPASSFTINSLPVGTKYQTMQDEPCDLDQLDPNTGLPLPGASCQFSGVVGSVRDTTSFKPTNETPICQQIFWRTLYGNEPTFKNQYWNIPGGPRDCPDQPGVDKCTNTSVLPQAQACNATPYAGIPTSSGIAWGREMLTAVYNKLKANGVSITAPASTGADQPFISEFLYPVCAKNPYLCQDFLREECGAVDPADFLTNENLWRWCGCYMDDSRYKNYTDNYGVVKQCTPYCNAPNTIPLTDGLTTQPLYCQDNVCIMDDISITLAKSRFQGTSNNLNFSQICSGCGSGYNGGTVNEGNFNTTGNSTLNNVTTNSCNCIISNFTLNTLNTTITGDGINLSEACNGKSTCYNTVTNSDGTQTATPVDCANTGIGVNDALVAEKNALEKRSKNISVYWALFLGLLAILIIVVLWLIFSPSKIPENDIVFSRKIPVPQPPPQYGIPYTTLKNVVEKVAPPVDLSPVLSKLDSLTSEVKRSNESIAKVKDEISNVENRLFLDSLPEVPEYTTTSF